MFGGVSIVPLDPTRQEPWCAANWDWSSVAADHREGIIDSAGDLQPQFIQRRRVLRRKRPMLSY